MITFITAFKFSISTCENLIASIVYVGQSNYRFAYISFPTMSEFQVVSKKVRKSKVAEVKELILVCQDAFDWEEGFNYVGEINTVKDLESFGEKKRLPWYFHGFSPSRQLIFTVVKGKKSEFKADETYLRQVVENSNAPDSVKAEIQAHLDQ